MGAGKLIASLGWRYKSAIFNLPLGKALGRVGFGISGVKFAFLSLEWR